ncbi:MAG TPA: alpha/beta hydrolase [Thermomicrobiales bacterium]|nr:alpha/beta hydrolase [Thermomicrobiales bacterium]
MPVTDRADASIFWEERGDGEAILLVHGGLFDPMTGERFWTTPGVTDDLAATGYRVLVPDRRYSPDRTTASFAAHNWDIEADDLAAILNATGVERAHVVAGSNGCSAATRLALRHPERVATLVLCWPAAPTTAATLASFEQSAAAVERDGTASYLDALRRDGVPRPGEERPGFPFGFALLHDHRTASSFLTQTGTAAARIFRETAAALLPGDPIRGLTRDDAARLGSNGFPIYVMPAEPEDPYHLRAVAHALRAAIPGATLTRGFPVTTSRFFAAVGESFALELQPLLRLNDGDTAPP